MSETKGNKVANLFTKGSHHTNTSVIYIVQNIFNKNQEMRTISLNAHYIALFKSPRDVTQVRYLNSQMFPDHPKFLTAVYKQACGEAHGYFVLDTSQYAQEELKVRSKIFPQDAANFCYIPE
jgi:hypothetical protein